MGRVLRAVGQGSGRSSKDTKKVERVRRKRKKRRNELEELHRNALEAKRNLRLEIPQHKRKAPFVKVLDNFADKRLENVDVIGNGNKQTKPTKSKKICDRLLPEPMVGMFKNGAKGHEICRVVGQRLSETNIARLRCNVLKLLKGDETTKPKFPSVRGEDEIINKSKPGGNDHTSDESDKSDHAKEYGYLVKCGSGQKKPKNLKRINRDRARVITRRNELTAENKDRPIKLPRQRNEDKCKRRLFQPDDEDKQPNDSYGIIDHSEITEDITKRFTPNHRRDDDPCDNLKTPKNRIQNGVIECLTDGQANCDVQSKLEEKLFTPQNGESRRINFWGWSPVACYERLCAIVCIDNFENDHRRRYKAPEQVIKIQRILTGLYVQSARNLPLNQRDLSMSDRETEQDDVSKVKLLTYSDGNRISQVVGNVKNDGSGRKNKQQAMSQDSSLDASSSSMTMVGSWHPPESFNDRNDMGQIDNSNVKEPEWIEKAFRDETRIDSDRRAINRWSNDSNGLSSLSKHENGEKCNRLVEKTINSVSVFLNAFRQHNPLNNRMAKITSDWQFNQPLIRKRTKNKKESCSVPLDWTIDYNTNNVLRKTAKKHVPTILRRPSGPTSSELDKTTLENEQVTNVARRNVDVERVRRNASPRNTENQFTSANPMTPPLIKKIHSQINRDFFPSEFSTFTPNNANFHHPGIPKREMNKKFIKPDVDANKIYENLKFHSTIEKCRPNVRLVVSNDYGDERSEENEYEKNMANRDIRKTSRTFVNIVNAKDQDAGVNHSIPCDEEMNDDFHRVAGMTIESDHRTTIRDRNDSFVNQQHGYPSYSEEGKYFRMDPNRFDPSVIHQGNQKDRVHHVLNRGVPKKPTVLFRPIEEPRDKSMRSEICNAHKLQICDPHAESATTMSEVVKNLKVMAFEKNNGKPTGSIRASNNYYSGQHDAPSRFYSRQDPGMENIRSPYAQASKFRACVSTNGENPRRIPIYINADVVLTGSNDHPGVLKMIDNDKRLDTAGVICVSSSFPKKNGGDEETLISKLEVEPRLVNGTFSNVPYSCHCSTSTHPVKIGYTDPPEQSFVYRVPRSPQAPTASSCINRDQITSSTNLNVANNNSTNLFSKMFPVHHAAPRTQCRYESSIQERNIDCKIPQRQSRFTNVHFSRNDRDFTALPKKIVLSDGRIGTLVNENFSTDPTLECANINNVGQVANLRFIDAAEQRSDEIRQRRNLSKDGIVYSQFEYP